MARLVLLAALVVVVAGCSDSLPGAKVVSATPQTVIGAVSTPWTGGSAASGGAVFTSAGCGACHAYAPAHSVGKIGPDLTTLSTTVKLSGGTTLAEYVYNAIVSPGSLTVPGYQAGIMPASFGQSLKPKQLADLVAFLTKGS